MPLHWGCRVFPLRGKQWLRRPLKSPPNPKAVNWRSKSMKKDVKRLKKEHLTSFFVPSDLSFTALGFTPLIDDLNVRKKTLKVCKVNKNVRKLNTKVTSGMKVKDLGNMQSVYRKVSILEKVKDNSKIANFNLICRGFVLKVHNKYSKITYGVF